MANKQPQLVDKQTKQLRMKKNLAHIQTKLKPAHKSFSRVVHQPQVRSFSDLAEKTIARPAGLLGGGFVSLVGNALYIWVCHRYNLDYNYTAFLLLFLIGFVIGVLGEITLLWAYRSSHR